MKEFLFVLFSGTYYLFKILESVTGPEMLEKWSRTLIIITSYIIYIYEKRKGNIVLFIVQLLIERHFDTFVRFYRILRQIKKHIK